MSSFSNNARSTMSESPLRDKNYHQLNLILQKAIPRADVLHKIVNYINITKLDGKTFLSLSDKRLADLASRDPLIISQFHVLRKAQSPYIHSLLAPRRERSPELTTPTEEHSSEEGLRDEEFVDLISNSSVQSHRRSNDAPDADSQNLIADTVISPGAAEDTQTSTDAAHHDRNGSSQSPPPTTFNPEPECGLEPAGDALGPTSPIDPFTIPLPDNSELDFLNPQENDNITQHDKGYSEEDPVSSELESDGLSTNEGSMIDDESQASSVVGHQDAGETHVFVGVDELHGGSLSSLLDVIPPDSLIEDSSIVPEELLRNPTQSLPADQANPLHDQTISAHAPSPDVSHSDGQNLKDNTEHGHESHDNRPVLPAPSPAKDVQQEVSREDSPTQMNPEVDMREAKASQNLTTTTHESVDFGSSSDGVSDPPHLVSTSKEAPSEIVTSGSKGLEQVSVVSIMDELPVTILSTQSAPETTHRSGDVSPEVPDENMVNQLLEDKTVAVQFSNPEDTDFEGNLPSDSEQLPSPLSNPMAHDSSEAHDDIASDSTGPEVCYSAQEAEDITFDGPITVLEGPTNSAPNGLIQIAYEELSPSGISIGFDVSPTMSPAPSSLSAFSDSPFSARTFPEFHFLPPHLKDGNALLFCEICEVYHAFLTSTLTGAVEIPPFLCRPGLNIDDDEEDSSQPRLVGHPLSSRDDSTHGDLDFPPVINHFDVSSSLNESSQNRELASVSDVQLIDLVNEFVPEISIQGAPAYVEPSLLDDQGAEPIDPASDTVPDVALNPVHSGINADEPSTETEEAPTLHVVEALRFSRLPPINTNIASLMLDSQISAFLSPDDCSTYNRIVRASSSTSLPSPSRSSPASPTRTLFPRSGSCTSDKTIAEYTKRLLDSREAREGAVGRSFFCDVATQTESESVESQHRLPELQVETSTLGSVASTLASPFSGVFQLFRG